MIRCWYSWAMVAAQPLLRRKLRRRGRSEPGYLVAMDERFGHYKQATDGGRLWIHAVSLGETRAAAVLIQALRQQQPGLRLLLTHGTATGRAEGQRLLQAGDAQAWLPWDTPAAVERFLTHFQPCAGVLMETEVWPNLVAACRARGIPLALANARLSAASLTRAKPWARLARPTYAGLTAVWAQTETDAERLSQLGARVTGVWGNLKFDATPEERQLAQGQRWRSALTQPVILLASSREGEDDALLQLLAERKDKPTATQAGPATDSSSVQWLIVPRHPQRFDTVAAQAKRLGLTVSRRSQWQATAQPADVWIGDSLGEMAMYYSLASAALLGGSFEPLGGQNLIEAAACGCPLVMGPHTFNFEQAAQQAVQAGAAARVASLRAGVEAACALAHDAHRLATMREQAFHFAATHRGAAAKTAQALRAQLLPRQQGA